MQITHAARGRAFGPGPVAVSLVLAAVALGGCSSAHGSAAAAPKKTAFGGFPSFLPKDTVGSGALHNVVDATVASPDLATQGDTVKVHLSQGTVLATVSGPEVPNEGLPLQSPISPCTWTVTLADPSAAIPVDPASFVPIDDENQPYKVSLVSGSTPPATLAAGATTTFKIRTSMKVGEGLLRWVPDGKHSPVEWDFVVEDD